MFTSLIFRSLENQPYYLFNEQGLKLLYRNVFNLLNLVLNYAFKFSSLQVISN